MLSKAQNRVQSKSTVGLSWFSIFRLGLVQASLGSIVVLTNSTLNRVMVVELGLAALIPGLLVGIHYAVQLSRPVWGHRSDVGKSRTAWILGGLALLAISGTAAAATTFWFEADFLLGFIASVVTFIFIGVGIGASGTCLLAMMATKTAPERRASAATITWMMMIAGIVITSIITGTYLEPYSHARLVFITALAGTTVFVISAFALAGIEKKPDILRGRSKSHDFRESIKEVWRDQEARLFTIFIFVSMFAYSTQDLILEPFAGLLFSMSPGETTKLSGAQHAGVFVGMAIVGVVGGLFSRRKPGLIGFFIVAGCLGSALALGLLAVSAFAAPQWPLRANIMLMGIMNGAFAVAAVGTMMVLAGRGRTSNEGVRMGVWGAAQAVSFGLGGVAGTVLLTLGRWTTSDDSTAFGLVFAFEAILFLMSAIIALRIGVRAQKDGSDHPVDYRSTVPAE